MALPASGEVVMQHEYSGTKIGFPSLFNALYIFTLDFSNHFLFLSEVGKIGIAL